MFRQIIFVIMLGWVLVLSGCAATDKGHNIEGEDFRPFITTGIDGGTGKSSIKS